MYRLARSSSDDGQEENGPDGSDQAGQDEESGPLADKSVGLQDEINSLPSVIDYYSGKIPSDEVGRSFIKDRVKRLRKWYFDGITDEQAGQIAPSKLYANLIMMRYLEVEEDADKVLSNDYFCPRTY